MLNFIDLIDRFLMEKDRRARKGHYPSDVLACRRQLWYKWKNIEQSDPPSPGNLLKMEMGNIIHEWVCKVLQKMGFDIIVENSDVDGETKEFYDPRLKKPFRYRTDSVFIDPDEIRAVIEIKSSYGAGVKEVQKKGPKDGQFAQALLYMMVEKVQRVYFIFIGRDNGYRTQHIQEADIINDLFEDGRYHLSHVRIDRVETMGNPRYRMKLRDRTVPITYDNMVAKLQEIEALIEGEDLAPRDYVAPIKNGEIQRKYQYKGVIYSCWQCSYCGWKNKCWEKELKIYANSNNAEMFGGMNE